MKLVPSLAKVLLGVLVEGLLAAHSTEVVLLPPIVGSSCCLAFLYLHFADWVNSH
jgi:hypothetical protein